MNQEIRKSGKEGESGNQELETVRGRWVMAAIRKKREGKRELRKFETNCHGRSFIMRPSARGKGCFPSGAKRVT
jgi:hypothetical protein